MSVEGCPLFNSVVKLEPLFPLEEAVKIDEIVHYRSVRY